MRTITLRHLDNREFARIIDAPVFRQSAASATIDAVCFEFDCDEDAITFDENDDGAMIMVDGLPVAQQFIAYRASF